MDEFKWVTKEEFYASVGVLDTCREYLSDCYPFHILWRLRSGTLVGKEICRWKYPEHKCGLVVRDYYISTKLNKS